jgi:FAD/FMN-containing dehydrogenase
VSSTRSSDLLAVLRDAIAGRVVGPNDAGYDELRTVFPGGVNRRPAAIACPANPQDVQYIVKHVRDSGLALAVRSGGHTVHATTDGGVVLDLRDMNRLDIDAANRTVWAETGLTAAEYSNAVGKHGLGTGFGDTGSVGIGGITLGGGIGYLTRKYGLTIDSLIAADVVTADGERRRVSADEHADLFWAIRGGGGNFGIATRFQFRLQPVDSVVGGMLVLPATEQVIVGFVEAAEAAPEELSTIANVMMAPPMPFLPPELHGQLIVLGLMCYVGKADAGERVLSPFRQLATPLADMVRPVSYAELFPPDDPSFHPTAVGRSLYLNRVGRDEARTILDYLRASDAPMRVAQLRVLGGAVARIRDDATAFVHRQRRIMAYVAAFYTGEQDRAARLAWVADFAEALDQNEPGAYVNFLNNEGPERVRAAYAGPTWERLTRIKARYDPANFFRLNENIPPTR